MKLENLEFEELNAQEMKGIQGGGPLDFLNAVSKRTFEEVEKIVALTPIPSPAKLLQELGDIL